MSIREDYLECRRASVDLLEGWRQARTTCQQELDACNQKIKDIQKNQAELSTTPTSICTRQNAERAAVGVAAGVVVVVGIKAISGLVKSLFG